jgi:hypothetical protein
LKNEESGNVVALNRFCQSSSVSIMSPETWQAIWKGSKTRHIRTFFHGRLPGGYFAYIVAMIYVAPLCAWAALGGDLDSVQADQTHMKASRRLIGGGEKYAIHELRSTSGTAVREYTSPQGSVFGVAWQGPMLPDLRQVLGAHFERYVEVSQTKRVGHGPLIIQTPGLIVQSTGHMRAFVGKAYVPEMLPPGVTADEIR